jgi:hypothetical protein
MSFGIRTVWMNRAIEMMSSVQPCRRWGAVALCLCTTLPSSVGYRKKQVRVAFYTYHVKQNKNSLNKDIQIFVRNINCEPMRKNVAHRALATPCGGLGTCRLTPVASWTVFPLTNWCGWLPGYAGRCSGARLGRSCFWGRMTPPSPLLIPLRSCSDETRSKCKMNKKAEIDLGTIMITMAPDAFFLSLT